MRNKVSYSDIYDINKKTGALILGANRLDDYATKFLNKYCSEALVNPMPIPVEKILKDMNLSIVEERLSANFDIFGCCLLLDSEVKVYNPKTKEYSEKFFKEGTIIVDPVSAMFYGEGAKRNTLIHEIIHWEKDKTYFSILKYKNTRAAEKLYPIMCRRSESFYEPSAGKQTKENEVKWLEWQAHKLAPRILMPKESFRKKAEALLSKENITCSELVKEISQFFKVSQESSRYRLFEVGLKKELSHIPDFEKVFGNQLEKIELVKLMVADAFELLEINKELSAWVDEGRFVFADGYFVLANKKYVKLKNGKLSLTPTAKRRLSKCVINISAQYNVDYPMHGQDAMGNAVLYKDNGIDKRLYLFKPENQSALVREPKPEDFYGYFSDVLDKENINEEIEFEKLLADPTKTLCDCLWYSFRKNDWMLPEKFNEETELHKNYHGKIRSNKYNNMGKDVLWPICIGLRYSVRTIQKVFSKSENKLKELEEPDRIYIRILEMVPGISLSDFNGILRARNMKELGSEIKL